MEGIANGSSGDWAGPNPTRTRIRRYATIGKPATAIATLALISTESYRRHLYNMVSTERRRLSASTLSLPPPTAREAEVRIASTAGHRPRGVAPEPIGFSLGRWTKCVIIGCRGIVAMAIDVSTCILGAWGIASAC